jgi:hypothetical protein
MPVQPPFKGGNRLIDALRSVAGDPHSNIGNQLAFAAPGDTGCAGKRVRDGLSSLSMAAADRVVA